MHKETFKVPVQQTIWSRWGGWYICLFSWMIVSIVQEVAKNQHFTAGVSTAIDIIGSIIIWTCGCILYVNWFKNNCERDVTVNITFDDEGENNGKETEKAEVSDTESNS